MGPPGKRRARRGQASDPSKNASLGSDGEHHTTELDRAQQAPRNFHPVANAFPLLAGDQFEDLVLDVEAHGLREAITLHHEEILDGRNRYRACIRAKVEPRFVEWDCVGTPESFVISKNLARRHLTAGQRAMIAAKLGDFGHGGDRSKVPNGTLKITEAGQALNVSERSVKRAKAVRKYGSEKLVEAVEAGAMSVAAAEREAKGKPEETKNRRECQRTEKQHQDAGPVIISGPSYYDCLCSTWNACSEDEQGRFLIHISWDVVEDLKRQNGDLKKALDKEKAKAKPFPSKPRGPRS